MTFRCWIAGGLCAVSLLAQAAETENWNAHFQSTYAWQEKAEMSSPYQGGNSLLARREKSYSFTATAALGVRVAEHTELYVDPEVAQGVPLSGLLGLAGFTNGELAKTSGSSLKGYRARLFMRQTIGLGGESTWTE
ncbi:MAG TPA: carbohydrate porin, partial [Aquabacterium sp.]|nr:carbohydrate porin [Aquabacterium sp.]